MRTVWSSESGRRVFARGHIAFAKALGVVQKLEPGNLGMLLHLCVFASGCRRQTGHKLSRNHRTLLVVDHFANLLLAVVDLVLDFAFMLQVMV
jgi:hypothetical protein